MPKQLRRAPKQPLPSTSSFVRHWNEAYGGSLHSFAPSKAFRKVEDDIIAWLRGGRLSAKRLEILKSRVDPDSAFRLRGVIERIASEIRRPASEGQGAASARIYGIPLAGKAAVTEAAFEGHGMAGNLQLCLKDSGFSHPAVHDVILPVVLAPSDIHELDPSDLHAVSTLLFKAAQAPNLVERAAHMADAEAIARSWKGRVSRSLEITRRAMPHLPDMRFVIAAHVADVAGEEVHLLEDGLSFMHMGRKEHLSEAQKAWGPLALGIAEEVDVMPLWPQHWNGLRMSLAEHHVQLCISDLVRMHERDDIDVTDAQVGMDVHEGVLLLHVIAKGSFLGTVPVPQEYMHEEDGTQFLANLVDTFQMIEASEPDDAMEEQIRAYTRKIEEIRRSGEM